MWRNIASLALLGFLGLLGLTAPANAHADAGLKTLAQAARAMAPSAPDASSSPAAQAARIVRPRALYRRETWWYGDAILTRHTKKLWFNSYSQYKTLNCRERLTRFARLCRVIFIARNFDVFGGALAVWKKPRGVRYYYRGILVRLDGDCILAGNEPEACIKKWYRFGGLGGFLRR